MTSSGQVVDKVSTSRATGSTGIVTTAPEKDHVLVREKEKTYTFVPRRFAGAP
jgi:hypothetical protein